MSDTPKLTDAAEGDSVHRLVGPLTDAERAANHRELSKMHRGNRFRLMLGLPPLPEPHKVQQVLNDECVRCSVASLFGMQREDVPHFFQEGNGSWAGPLDDWLKNRGMKMEVWSATLTLPEEHEYYLAYGDAASISGVGHMVVMRKGLIWHDPSGCGISRFEAWIAILPLNNNADENLAALCQSCHLNYDSGLHVENARRNREAKRLKTEPTLFPI